MISLFVSFYIILMLLFSPHCSPQLFFFLDREKVVPSFEGGGPSLTFSFREEGRIASCHKKFPSVRKKEGEDDDVVDRRIYPLFPLFFTLRLWQIRRGILSSPRRKFELRHNARFYRSFWCIHKMLSKKNWNERELGLANRCILCVSYIPSGVLIMNNGLLYREWKGRIISEKYEVKEIYNFCGNLLNRSRALKNGLPWAFSESSLGEGGTEHLWKIYLHIYLIFHVLCWIRILSSWSSQKWYENQYFTKKKYNKIIIRLLFILLVTSNFWVDVLSIDVVSSQDQLWFFSRHSLCT